MSVRARDVRFGYSPTRGVFSDLSFEIPEGLTVVLGPNGSGKSTLLRLLLGALTPSHGAIELDGVPVRTLSAPARAKRIAYVAQRPSVASAFTVREVVALGRYALTPDLDAVERQLEALELTAMASRVFASLSVGEQQRVSLARALAQLECDPGGPRRVLLADEPTSAMDPRWVAHSAAVLRSLPERGIDALVVLHDFTLACRLADTVLVLDETGTIAGMGTPDEILQPALLSEVFSTPFTRESTADGPILIPKLTYQTGGTEST